MIKNHKKLVKRVGDHHTIGRSPLKRNPLIKACLFGSLMLIVQHAFALQFTVSVPPLAGLIQPLLDKEDTIVVLLKPGVSPHGFQLKPSHLRAIESSDAVFSIGTPVDYWLEKTLQRVEKPVLKMSELQALHTLPIRNGGLWLQGGDDDGDKHAHEHSHAHQPDVQNKLKNRGHYDGHIWLSLDNAMLFVNQAAAIIKQLKPTQVDFIEQNKQAWLTQLKQLDTKLKKQLDPVKDRPFVVLHDAYQYFEKHYQLNGVGSVRLNPAISPSLKRVQQLRNSIKQGQIACVFKEPQFPEKRVLAVVRGLDVKVGSLDPMGSFLLGRHAKKEAEEFVPYDVLLQALANAITTCLTPQNKE